MYKQKKRKILKNPPGPLETYYTKRLKEFKSSYKFRLGSVNDDLKSNEEEI